MLPVSGAAALKESPNLRVHNKDRFSLVKEKISKL
jgi:hypothetical protein